MADIWFISDTHWHHSNMLRFLRDDGTPVRQGFRDVGHMNETMIERWNETVRPRDKVYHLGDVALGCSVDAFERTVRRLNGHKRLLLGNHDTMDVGVYGRHFRIEPGWRVFTDGTRTSAFVASHFPLHQASLPIRYAGRCLNVHGHVHLRSLTNPQYVNVCVEVVDYRPVHIDELWRAARTLACADHAVEHEAIPSRSE